MVKAARDKSTDEAFAVKQMRPENDKEGISASTVREVAVLRKLQHVNIVRLISLVVEDDLLWLVLERCDYDLKTYMRQHLNGRVPDAEVRCFCAQLLRGVEYCHRLRLVHRDLKPQNLLVMTASKTLKIADFGLTRELPDKKTWRPYTPEIMTLWYRSPEILLGLKLYNPYAIDVWSIGCILAELCRGEPMAPGASEIDQLFKIFQTLGTPNQTHWKAVTKLENWNNVFPKWNGKCFATEYGRIGDDGVDLLCTLLRYDPDMRITIANALKHPYFSDAT